LLDASPAFSASDIYKRLGEYGETGRRNYQFRNMTVDVLLPLSVLPVLFLLMRKALTAFSLRQFTRAALLSLPLIYVTFDLVENSIVLMLLRNYPERLDALAGILPYATIVQRLASLLAIAVPLTMLGSAAARRSRKASLPV